MIIVFTQNLLLIVLLALFCDRAAGTEDTWVATPRPEQIDVFSEQYLAVEIARNFPMSFSQNRFEPGEPHPVIGYRHRFRENWIMGLGGQFRIFQRRDVPQNAGATGALAVWTLYHEANYAMRLDHPTYLLIGPRVTYFLPCKAAVIPLERDPVLQAEIGAGLSVSIARIISDKWMMTARAERWRGTRTTLLQGLEVAFGINYAL